MALFRIQPQGPPQAYKSYSMVLPLATHWAPVSCADCECESYLHGWTTTVDESSALGQRQAHYIRHDSRKHTEERQNGLTVFTFQAGQPCFEPHRWQVRPPRFFVRPGDWRHYGAAREHTQAKFWVEDMSETLDQVRTAQQKG